MPCYSDRHPFIFTSTYWSLGQCGARQHLDCPCLQAALPTCGTRHSNMTLLLFFFFVLMVCWGIKAGHLCRQLWQNEIPKRNIANLQWVLKILMSQCIQRHAAILTWNGFSCSHNRNKKKKKKLQKGFYMKQIWQHKTYNELCEQKTRGAELRLLDAKKLSGVNKVKLGSTQKEISFASEWG